MTGAVSLERSIAEDDGEPTDAAGAAAEAEVELMDARADAEAGTADCVHRSHRG